MQKKLITKNDIEKMGIKEGTTFYVEKHMILSPGAKDYLLKKEVKLDYTISSSVPKKEDKLENLEELIKKILYKDYQIEDNHVVAMILGKIKN